MGRKKRTSDTRALNHEYLKHGKGGAFFKKGNPGKPKGAKNKVKKDTTPISPPKSRRAKRKVLLTTQLKENILKASLGVDLNGTHVVVTKKGKIIKVKNIKPTELLKLGASFVPKEIKAKVTDIKQRFLDITISKTTDSDLNDILISRLSHRNAAEDSLNDMMGEDLIGEIDDLGIEREEGENDSESK